MCWKKEVSHLKVTDSRVYLCLHRCIPKDRNPLGQPFLKSTPHFYFCEHQAQLRAIPLRFGEHHDALFLDSHQVQLARRSNLMMSKLLSWQLRADLLLVACFLHLSIAQGRMTRLHELCIGSYSATVYRLELSQLSMATCDQWSSLLVIEYIYVHKGEKGEVMKVQVRVGDISDWCYLQADASVQEGVGKLDIRNKEH